MVLFFVFSTIGFQNLMTLLTFYLLVSKIRNNCSVKITVLERIRSLLNFGVHLI